MARHLLLWLTATLGLLVPSLALTAPGCERGMDCQQADHAPFDLRCQHLPGRPAVDVNQPIFSWKLPQTGLRDISQHGYQIRISTAVTGDSDRSLDATQLVWDSGRVVSDDRYNVLYRGQALQSRTTYHWQVTWFGTHSNVTGVSEIASFHVALLSQSDWADASWVAAVGAETAPILSTSIAVPSGLTEASLYVSGLGWFRMSVNGVDVTPFALGPGWTAYHKEVYYITVDVTEHLQGVNTASISIQLGTGWRDPVFASKDGKFPDDKYPRVLRCQMAMKGLDGLTLVSSGQNWTWLESPIVSDSLYNGETYNATMKNLPQPLRFATVVTGPAGDMIVQPIAEIVVNRTVKPVKVTQPQTGVYVVDFGENLSGHCTITIPNAKGHTNEEIVMHFAEVLMHMPYGNASGLPYFANLRGAKATDTYIINGNEGQTEVYQPSFTYHGFRYVQITGWPGTLSADNIVMNHFYTGVNRSGTFQTSSKTMNAIQRNVWSGQESNTMSVLTDCDQRDERLGWMGDAGLSSDSFSLNFDMSAFFPNMLRNIVSEQGDDGSIPDIVPWVRGGGKPGDPSWSAAFPQIAWCLMNYYGDHVNPVKYSSYLMKYAQEMMGRSPEDFSKYPGSYGDWCPPAPNKRVATALPSSFSFTSNLRQIAAIVKVNTSEAAHLIATADDYTKRFEKAFVDSSGKYLDDLQVSYALGLTLDPTEASSAAGTKFISSIHSAKEHLTTGIIGAKFVLPLLSQMKQGDLAMQIVEQVDYPSWGWMIFNDIEPATAIWELWNAWESGPGMNSRNHHMFSSVSGWLRTHAVGFHITAPGMKELVFEPAATVGLSWANVSYDEPRHVEFHWQRHGATHCAKSAEGPSSFNGNLPDSEPLHITCGQHGGEISSVDFVSFGKPTGRCGFFSHDSTCHSNNSQALAASVCLGRAQCTLPTSADFWGNPCAGTVKRLYVQVTCSNPSSVTTKLTIPVGSKATLYLPSHGTENVVVQESGAVLWKGGSVSDTLVAGIHDLSWDVERDAVKVHLSSGQYSFLISGEAPSTSTIHQQVEENDVLHLKCPPEHRVTRVQHAEFGHDGCSVATAHFTTSQHCLMKSQCTLEASSNVFGTGCSRGNFSQRRRLTVEAQCSRRHI